MFSLALYLCMKPQCTEVYKIMTLIITWFHLNRNPAQDPDPELTLMNNKRCSHEVD